MSEMYFVPAAPGGYRGRVTVTGRCWMFDRWEIGHRFPGSDALRFSSDPTRFRDANGDPLNVDTLPEITAYGAPVPATDHRTRVTPVGRYQSPSTGRWLLAYTIPGDRTVRTSAFPRDFVDTVTGGAVDLLSLPTVDRSGRTIAGYREDASDGPADWGSVASALRWHRTYAVRSSLYRVGEIIDLYPVGADYPTHRLTIGPRLGVTVTRFG